VSSISHACTSPLDEPAAGSRTRSRSFFWPLSRVEGSSFEGPGWYGVELSTHHSREGREFFTALHPVTVRDNGTTQTSISLMTTPPWRKRQPVPRYSEKALAAFTTAALAELRAAYTADNAGVRALFAVPDGGNQQ
jgi:hypothetical protein